MGELSTAQSRVRMGEGEIIVAKTALGTRLSINKRDFGLVSLGLNKAQVDRLIRALEANK